MKLLFYGFRHAHVEGLYERAKNNARVTVAGCVEENVEARAGVSERLGVTFDERSYDEWLETDIDAVAIGGRYGDRGRAIIKALRAGKHVIADKPICTTVEEYEEIAALCREKGMKVACMLDLRYMPSARAAKELLDSGKLGQVRSVSYTGQHCLDFAHRPKWYFEKGMHGGTLNDLAIHGVDLITHLTGFRMSEINAARCWNAYATEVKDFKDCAMYMATLENGAGVIADVSYSAPSQIYATEIYWNFKFWCDNGLLTFNITNPNAKVYYAGEKEVKILDGVKDTKNYLDDFMDEIENGGSEFTESVLCTTEQVLHLQRSSK